MRAGRWARTVPRAGAAVALAVAALAAACGPATGPSAPAPSAAASSDAASGAPRPTGQVTAAASSTPNAAAAPPSRSSSSRAATGGTSSAGAPAVSATGIPAFSHVFIIVMENLGYGAAVGLPYISQLAARYAVATAYDSVAHPSLPNYLALTSGETWVSSDCFFCYVNAPNLGQEASAAGLTWGAYMQGLPQDCYLGPFDLATNYAGKHDPFRYYDDIRSSPALCAHIQPLRSLEALLPRGPGAAVPPGAVPRLDWITPNLCNDGHDCAATTADAWLSGFVPRILASPAWQKGGVLFITWDEGSGGDDSACCGVPPGEGGGHILTLVVAPGLPPGLRVSVPYDHYSLLATMEDGLGLPLLGQARSTPPMAAFWQRPAGGAPPATAGVAGPG